MTKDIETKILTKTMSATWRVCRWFLLQVILMFLMPYLWADHYSGETICLMMLYTAIYATYWETVPKGKRLNWLFLPYFIYSGMAVLFCGLIKTWNVSVWYSFLLPIYGATCVIIAKICGKQSRRFRKKYKFGKVVTCAAVFLLFVALKSISVSWESSKRDSFEKQDILARKDYLQGKLIADPRVVLDEMPAAIGTQFQGEWALYSCSMLSSALVNISQLYPETKAGNIQLVDSLINIVMSPELRHYDTMRWGEDPLESLDGDESHVSYLSHLAWMICGYKQIGGDSKYDKLLSSLCGTMNRRLLNRSSLNLPTYPEESIYIPDMLVAIVALNQYADMNNGKYRSTVKKWTERAQKEWIDDKTGLLVSFLQENGKQYKGVPVKGSYSALNCYYLTFIDETFAKQQYEKLKSLFWKDGAISGLKEYYDRTCHFGMDIDAGPILFELSPSGTAFMTGAATYFNDLKTRNDILTTSEIAGHTVRLNGKRHYLLADVALVGEAIMLAMRTHFKFSAAQVKGQ